MLKSSPQSPPGASVIRPTTLPAGPHPGFAKLPSDPRIARCKLRAVTAKSDPNHADYLGTIHIAGQKATAMIWCHADGSLGLRIAFPRKGEQP